MSPNLEVIVGTYEQFLLGYTVDDVVNYKMEQSFATHSHLASVRSVASNKYYLASAAADDAVCLYDMRSRTESGKLVHHNDTVNSISFTPDASHLITASSDGTIGIVRCGNWQLEKHWLKAHKGMAVDTLAVHPTGKIAMTTGHDGVLRTWNLVKGRQAYATNLVPRWKVEAKNISILKWSPSGNSYLLGANNKIDIYSVATAGIEEELTFESKVVCVEYLSDKCLTVGLTDGKIIIYDLEKSKQSGEIQAHDARVKCLSSNGELLVSASSSGEIKLWSIDKNNLVYLNKVNCSARISCLTLNTCQGVNVKKDEEEIKEIVAQKTSNKIRLKQQVIIEDEGIEIKSNSQKKGKKKNARKSIEIIENDEQSKDVPAAKKIKANSKSFSKKQKLEESEFEAENVKKKKLSHEGNKRKEIVDDVTEPSLKKKKKLKSNLPTEKTIVPLDQTNKNKKKRQNVKTEQAVSPPKKQKTLEYASLKKKKKKNLLKPVPR